MSLMSDSTSQSLLESIRDRKDGFAWSAFEFRYKRILEGHLRKLAPLSEGDLNDILQEVWRRFIAKLDEFRHNGQPHALRGYLKTMALHQLQEFLRKKKRSVQTREHQDALAQLANDQSEVSLELERQETAFLVSMALKQLESEVSPQVYRAFKRQQIDAESVERVAAELGTSPGYVRTAKSRCLKRLRHILEFLPEASSFL